MMQKWLEALLVLFVTVLIASVVAIGLISLDNLKKIEDRSALLNQPNNTILNLRLLVAEMNNAESNVRSYNLYRNDDYLSSYQASVSLIDYFFDSLYFYQKGNKKNEAILDSLNLLVERKCLLLNQQLFLRDDEKVISKLSAISKKLAQVPLEDSLNSGQVSERKGLLSRIFSRKQEVVITGLDDSLIQRSIQEIQWEVGKVRKEQSDELQKMKFMELGLIEKDKQISKDLRTRVQELERDQAEQLRLIGADNVTLSAGTNSLIRIFAGLILVLLVSLIVLLLFYFYRGAQYRKNLRASVERANSLAKTRETFLSNMSHEMRTPLNAIIGFSEQLMKSRLDESQKEQVSIVNSSSGHLLRLVNNLLEKSRIDSGKMKTEVVSFQPEAVLIESLKLVEVMAKAKEIGIRSAFEIPAGQFVLGDPFILKQILLNVLGNAVKFTERGEVMVKAELRNLDDNRVQMNFTVNDSGIGISSDKIDRVFEEFHQADNSAGGKYGGTGLGLWITKKLVEIQGGSIKMESEPGKGTSVYISIPYSLVAHEPVPEVRKLVDENVAADCLNNKKILVVDDELYNRKLLSSILSKYKAEVVEASSGMEAFEFLKKDIPALALVDIHMEGWNGFELAGKIRNELGLSAKDLPIIAITADAGTQKTSGGVWKGIDAFISKPFREIELMKMLLKHLDHEKV